MRRGRLHERSQHPRLSVDRPAERNVEASVARWHASRNPIQHAGHRPRLQNVRSDAAGQRQIPVDVEALGTDAPSPCRGRQPERSRVLAHRAVRVHSHRVRRRLRQARAPARGGHRGSEDLETQLVHAFARRDRVDRTRRAATPGQKWRDLRHSQRRVTQRRGVPNPNRTYPRSARDPQKRKPRGVRRRRHRR